MRKVINPFRFGILPVLLITLIIGCGGDEEDEPIEIIVTGTVEGKVVNQATLQGIPGLTVQLGEVLTTVTNNEGAFIFDEVKSDTYTVRVSGQGFLEQEIRIKVTSKGATVTIRLQPGVRVAGFVTSEEGNSVGGVRVTLGERASVTNGVGRYEISPILSGQYNLVAEKAGYESVRIQGVSVGGDDLEQDITIQRQLEGTLVFARANQPDQTFFGLSSVDARGIQLVTLTNFSDESPTWSPDGRDVVFTRSENNSPRQIYVMSGIGGGATNISGPHLNDRNPAWSPDGRQIAFVHAEILEPSAVYIMDVNGNNRGRLAECTTRAQPAWSPDGTRIAFARRLGRGADTATNLFVVTIDEFITAQNRPPEPPPVVDPNNPNPPPPVDEDDIEEGVRELTRNPQTQVHPDWSPDGSKLVFTIEENSTSADVYILDLFSGQQTRLTDKIAYNGYPCWSPDGTKVAFSSSRDGDFGLWVIDADGSNMTRIFDKPGEDELLAQKGWHR